MNTCWMIFVVNWNANSDFVAQKGLFRRSLFVGKGIRARCLPRRVQEGPVGVILMVM